MKNPLFINLDVLSALSEAKNILVKTRLHNGISF